jgi:hypothetical protein
VLQSRWAQLIQAIYIINFDHAARFAATQYKHVPGGGPPSTGTRQGLVHFPALAPLASSIAQPAQGEAVMNHSRTLKASAILMASFGLALLLAPTALVSAYKGPELIGPGIYNSMLYGGSLITIAVMNWLASRGDIAGARIIILGNLVGNVLGLCVTLHRQLVMPDTPPAAWINVGIFFVLLVLFTRLQLELNAIGRGAGRRASVA